MDEQGGKLVGIDSKVILVLIEWRWRVVENRHFWSLDHSVNGVVILVSFSLKSSYILNVWRRSTEYRSAPKTNLGASSTKLALISRFSFSRYIIFAMHLYHPGHFLPANRTEPKLRFIRFSGAGSVMVFCGIRCSASASVLY